VQMGTSHLLGQNFARVFETQFLTETGEQEFVWQTSWGVSTRLVGALIMGHGDDNGLCVPPRLAPVQVVVLVVRDEDGVGERAAALAQELRGAGARVEVDARVATSFGRRAVEWELKGVPVRIELGPRDLAAGNATLVRRDDNTKTAVPLVGLGRRVTDVLDDVQRALQARARSFRDDHTVEATSLDDGREAAQSGFARLPWKLVGDGPGEARLAEKSVSVRCLQRADGSVPASRDETDLVAIVGRSY
jgi:prolyl-tRNA synthetase